MRRELSNKWGTSVKDRTQHKSKAPVASLPKTTVPETVRKTLRWGYSTGACAAAAAVAAWKLFSLGKSIAEVRLLFLDGRERYLPLLGPRPGTMAAVRKDGGDDPDCTHGATIYANLRPCTLQDALPADYVLPVGDGMLVLRINASLKVSQKTALCSLESAPLCPFLAGEKTTVLA